MPNELLLDAAAWFRLYFVGKPYVTMIGSLKKNNGSFCIISIVQETSNEGLLQYRIIIRSRKVGFLC